MSAVTQQSHTSVIFDVDSASIGVAVVGYGPDKKLPQREYFSKRMQLDTNHSFEQFFAKTVKNLESLANEALRNSPHVIDDIYVSLSVPWVSSQKRKVNYTEGGKPFTFTEQLAQHIIDKELAEPLAKNLDYHHYDDVEIFERRTVDIYLNGYPSLYPFKGLTPVKDVQIHSVTSVISKTTKDAFIHTIERVFHREPVLISNTIVQYKALETFIPNENSAMIVDMGGTNTQILVVHDDHLVDIASFPVGREHIIEQVMSRAKVTREKARSMVQLFTKQTLEPEYQQQLSVIMNESYKVWMKPWFELCDKLSAKKLLPATLCVTAPDDINAWLRYHILQTDELIEHIHSSRMPQIIDISLFLQSLAGEMNMEHLSDPEMIPLIDVVGSIIQEQSTQ